MRQKKNKFGFEILANVTEKFCFAYPDSIRGDPYWPFRKQISILCVMLPVHLAYISFVGVARHSTFAGRQGGC